MWESVKRIIFETYIAKPSKKTAYLRREEFELLAYSKIVAVDILKEMRRRPKEAPLTIVVEYRDKMEELACRAPGYSGKNMFSIMADAAGDIIDLMICM